MSNTNSNKQKLDSLIAEIDEIFIKHGYGPGERGNKSSGSFIRILPKQQKPLNKQKDKEGQ